MSTTSTTTSPADPVGDGELSYDEILAILKDRYWSLRRLAMIAAGRTSQAYSAEAVGVYGCIQAVLRVPTPLVVRGRWRRFQHDRDAGFGDVKTGPWHYFPNAEPALCGVKQPKSWRSLSSPWHSEFGEQLVPKDGPVCRKCLRECDPRFAAGRRAK